MVGQHLVDLFGVLESLFRIVYVTLATVGGAELQESTRRLGVKLYRIQIVFDRLVVLIVLFISASEIDVSIGLVSPRRLIHDFLITSNRRGKVAPRHSVDRVEIKLVNRGETALVSQ